MKLIISSTHKASLGKKASRNFFLHTFEILLLRFYSQKNLRAIIKKNWTYTILTTLRMHKVDYVKHA